MNPRRCVSCRRALAAERMDRVVRRPDGTVTLDLTGKEQGRGAWLCRDPRCLVLARKKNLLAKALGVAVDSAVYDRLAERREGMEQALQGLDATGDLLSLLGLARRAGELVIGQDRVLELAATGADALLLFSSDCPDKIKEKLIRSSLPCLQLGQNRTELGRVLGLNGAVVVALSREQGFAAKAEQLIAEGRTQI